MDTMQTTLQTAQVGDEIEIECAGQKARRVVVTERDARHVYVTSGNVRPGNYSGGRIEDMGLTFGVQYQPTMAQQIRPVSALRIVRRAASRN